jgi:hypothetical protein
VAWSEEDRRRLPALNRRTLLRLISFASHGLSRSVKRYIHGKVIPKIDKESWHARFPALTQVRRVPKCYWVYMSRETLISGLKGVARLGFFQAPQWPRNARDHAPYIHSKTYIYVAFWRREHCS